MQMKSGGHEEPQPSEQPSTEQRTVAMRSSTSGSVTTCSLRPATRSTPPHLLDMPLVLIISQSSAAGAKQQQPEQQHMAAAMRGGSSGPLHPAHLRCYPPAPLCPAEPDPPLLTADPEAGRRRRRYPRCERWRPRRRLSLLERLARALSLMDTVSVHSCNRHTHRRQQRAQAAARRRSRTQPIAREKTNRAAYHAQTAAALQPAQLPSSPCPHTRWTRLVETVKMRKRREKTGKNIRQICRKYGKVPVKFPQISVKMPARISAAVAAHPQPQQRLLSTPGARYHY